MPTAYTLMTFPLSCNRKGRSSKAVICLWRSMFVPVVLVKASIRAATFTCLSLYMVDSKELEHTIRNIFSKYGLVFMWTCECLPVNVDWGFSRHSPADNDWSRFIRSTMKTHQYLLYYMTLPLQYTEYVGYFQTSLNAPAIHHGEICDNVDIWWTVWNFELVWGKWFFGTNLALCGKCTLLASYIGLILIKELDLL